MAPLSKVLVPFLVFFVSFINICFTEHDDCGYKGCHPTVAGKLNVHLVAHSHLDIGWLKTIDQYYYGGNKIHAPFGVQYILDSMISELLKKRDRRFVYVEGSFLWRWWQEQDEDLQSAVRMLIDEGRLQLLHGGWSMSDEATPHYSSLIDQMTLGLKFLNETFGECALPRVAWQIDAFGHSSEVALQFAQMGYDGLFFGRLDYEDYNLRKYMKNMEMVWRPDTKAVPGPLGELFTGVLYHLYVPPDGFCFDAYCSDEPIMDNPKLHGYNVNERIGQFVKAARLWSEAYKSPHVLITMGGDFNYIVASSWFKNMDKLIKYINEKYNDVNVLYSTPACYLKSLHSENITWPVKENDDFFPYGSDDHSYWTGYYTSRPSFKYLVYKANNLLQVCKQLHVSLGNNTLEEEESVLSRAMADSQHHDAVTGTEKQHVADDYATSLYEGFQACQKIVNTAYRKHLGNEYPKQEFCLWTNISMCHESETSSKFVLNVYNPLAHSVSPYIRVPVINGIFKVVSSSGAEIPSELITLPYSLFSIPGRRSNATHELQFRAENLPGLGSKSYHVEKINGNTESIMEYNITQNSTNGEVFIQNEFMQLMFNQTTGLLDYVSLLNQNVTIPFRQNFFFYEASKGYNYNSDNRASGAYIFRPARNFTYFLTDRPDVSVYKGKDVEEVRQIFDIWLSQVIRLYKGINQIEFQWIVGPIPVEKWMGKEVITRYSTNIQSNGHFWTDSNGRRMMQRIRNYRSSWNLTLSEPIASNYYPVTSSAYIKDNFRRMAVLIDRPQGATSLNNGELEFMLHRRLLYDDNKGVSEPLDEVQYGEGLVTRGTHYVQFSLSDDIVGPQSVKNTTNTDNPSSNGNDTTTTTFSKLTFSDGIKNQRLAAKSIISSPWISISKTHMSAKDWQSAHKMEYRGLLKQPLPDNVHLLTLQWWTSDTLLIRLEHIFEEGEHPVLSHPATVDIHNLLRDYTVCEVTELTLSASKELSKVSRLKWRYEGAKHNKKKLLPFDDKDSIKLDPMQIRTFKLHLCPQQQQQQNT